MEDQFCRVITFYLNGKKVTVTDAEPDMTLLAWLRSPAVGLTGTKLGCSEGGCGACSVLISNWDIDRKKIVHRAINACLAPVCSVDGCSVITIEGLGTSKNLHPVQERLAKFHGSQCGFCTPGIVMAVYAFLREHPNATRAELEDSMDGNLCRCTGYRPILDAIKTFGSDYGDCPLEEMVKTTHIEGGEVPHQHSQQKKIKGQFVCPSSGKPCDCGKTFAEEENKLEDKASHEETPAESFSEPIFPPQLKKYEHQSLCIQGKNCAWYRPVNLEELLQLKKTHGKLAKLVVGATEITLEMKMFNYGILIAPTAVPELNKVEITPEGINVGAAVSLTYLVQVLKEQVASRSAQESWLYKALIEQFRWFAGHQIRNAACLGGNIQTASPISDINPILMAAGAKVTVGSAGGIRRVVSMSDDFIRGYRQTCLEPEEVIISVHLPATRPHEYVMAYKQSRRRDDDIAIASASYRTLFEQQDNALVVKEMYMSYGGMSKQTVRAKQTEEYLKGKPWTEETFKGALHYLEQDLPLEPNAPGGMILYRKTLTTSFFYKYFLFLQQELAGAVPESYKNILGSFHRELSHGNQYYHMNKQSSQVGYPEVHVAALKQVTGEAIYTDDIPQPLNGLYAAFVWSTKARAKILGIDPSEALKMDGVRDFLSARDIPGINQVGIVAHDEEIMASQVVPCVGFPVGLVVAKTLKIAQKAAKLVKVQYEDLPAIITIDQAIEAKSFYHPIHKLEHGAVDAAFKECDHVLEGEMRVGGQDHFYLETHNALAIPGEEDEMTIWSSTQNPNEAQLKAAEALGIPANRIVVKIKRMGGGFGGKESRSFTVSSAAAVAAAKLRCPVRICLERDEDMFSTGGRHPFMGRYKVGFTNTGKILALQVELFANGGHSLDLSMGVIDRALFHVTNTYRVPNVRAVGHICKTNTPSNTAFRGFGAPQSMIICETWLDRVAKHLNMSQTVVRDLNFIKSGDITYYGQTMEDCHNVRIWKELLEISKYEERLAQVKKFNETSRWKKRGVYCVPTQYGMSFTVKHLNQANAMVHVYMDGSVSVTHAGCEMGQGLHTKMIQIAANELGVPIDKIYIADTSTDRVANGAPTAASVTSDLNGMAVLLACRELRRTLEPLRRQLGGEATWQQIARAAWMERLPLTAHGHYATPDLHFDWQVGTGRPFNYYNHGAACSEVEVDVLTGDFQILRTDIVMDVGNSINPAIDVGQIEGAFVQGLGLFTLEEVVTFADGRMFTRGPSTYKIPGFKDIPLEFNVHLLKDVPNPRAVHSSKGVGEPPLFLAASVFFAIKDAVAAARNETQRPTWFPLNSPATCERIRMSSKDDFTKQFDPNDAPY